MTRPALVILAAGLLLAGCASTIPVPATVAMPGMPNPEEALRQSMTHVDAEMAQLGVMAPGASVALALPALPEDLQRIVSFKWSGSLDQGVARLAQSIGYSFFTTAPADAQPVNVVIDISSVPAYQAFRTLGQQAGTLATVQVDPIHHQVQVIHHA